MEESETTSKSEALLSEAKKLRERKQVVDVDEKTVKLVIFTLEGELFAFYGDFVKEILPPVKIFFVPGCPDFIAGVINIRGDIESVLDIRGFLGLTPRSYGVDVMLEKANRIAIGDCDGFRSGIIVDSVIDVLDVAEHSIKPSSAAISSTIKDFAIGETLCGNKNVIVLDFKKIHGNL
ncbi:MAG: chemotaxis protein CheW [Nitrospirae bacterium YQR-1]